MASSSATAPAFELLAVRRGWGAARAPYNLAVGVRLEGERRRVSASLELVLELYAHVRHERPCHLIGGSGTAVELEEWGTDVRIRVNYTWTCQTSYETLERELEVLLAEAFEMHDRLDAPATDRRAASLATLADYLDDRGVACDIEALYERLVVE